MSDFSKSFSQEQDTICHIQIFTYKFVDNQWRKFHVVLLDLSDNKLYLNHCSLFCGQKHTCRVASPDLKELTHWPLGNLNEILDLCNFQTHFSDRWLRHLLSNCPNMNVAGVYWWSVNIGSGNGLVPSGNKPLPEPMLTQICRHMVSLGQNELICNMLFTLFWK